MECLTSQTLHSSLLESAVTGYCVPGKQRVEGSACVSDIYHVESWIDRFNYRFTYRTHYRVADDLLFEGPLSPFDPDSKKRLFKIGSNRSVASA